IKQWPELWNEVARDVMRTVCEKISFRAGDRLLVTGGEGHDTHHFYSYSGSPIFDVHGFVRGCLLNFTSLNSHRMRERRLNTLFELARETSYSSSPIEVLSAAMSVLRKNSEDFRFTLFLTPLEKGQWYLREWTGFTTPPHQRECFLEGDWEKKRFKGIEQGKILFHFFRDLAGTSEMFCAKISAGDNQHSTCLMFGLQSEFQFDDEYQDFIQRVSDLMTRSLRGAEAYVKAQNEQKSQRELIEQSQAQLELAVQNANDANRLKTSFLANMSHEIRTPLSAILGYSELLNEAKLTTTEAEYLSVINKNGQELSHLIDDILDLSKIEAGKLTIDSKPFCLSDLVQEVRSLFEIKAALKNLSLSVKIAADLPKVIVSDRTRVRQILINVVGNAIKFTQKGGVDIEVVPVVLRTESAKIHIRVTDTGVGLDESQRDDLFRPFVQLDHTRAGNYGGTGLGLALSRRLARALGGDLTIEGASLGEGCTFVIDFEAEIGKDFLMKSQDKLPAQNAVGNISKTFLLKDLKILVVDDSPDNRFLLTRMLKYQGADIIEASDGQEAVERAMSESFDVVLMDIQMPRMDGYSALAELRSRNYSKPIIALTAHAMKEEREKMLKAGFDGHVAKPVNQALLFDSIRSQLQ
ncbi:MAG: response regulator, partial [Proteobacteria bacterium]